MAASFDIETEPAQIDTHVEGRDVKWVSGRVAPHIVARKPLWLGEAPFRHVIGDSFQILDEGAYANAAKGSTPFPQARDFDFLPQAAP